MAENTTAAAAAESVLAQAKGELREKYELVYIDKRDQVTDAQPRRLLSGEMDEVACESFDNLADSHYAGAGPGDQEPAQPAPNELLIMTTLRAARDLGVARASLHFAVFRSALERGERIGAGTVAKTWFRTLIFASRWFRSSPCTGSTEVQPGLRARYSVFPGTTALPGVVRAHMGAEALVVRPKLLRR